MRLTTWIIVKMVLGVTSACSFLTPVAIALPPPAQDGPATQSVEPGAQMLDSVELKSVPLRDAIERLRTQAGVNLFVSWNVLGRAGVSDQMKVDVTLTDVPLGKVLDLILADAGGSAGKLAWTNDEGVIHISTFTDFERSAFLKRERQDWTEELRLEAKLEQRVGDVAFDRVPLWQAIETLAKRAGVKVFVPWNVLETAGVDRSQPISLDMDDPSAGTALAAVLTSMGKEVSLGYAIRGDTVEISTREGSQRLPQVHVYDVSDLLQPQLPADAKHVADAQPGGNAPRERNPDGKDQRKFGGADEIQALLQQTVDPDSWRDNGGSTGAIRVLHGRFAGLLVVTQSYENHREIARTLSAIRGFLPDDPRNVPQPAILD